MSQDYPVHTLHTPFYLWHQAASITKRQNIRHERPFLPLSIDIDKHQIMAGQVIQSWKIIKEIPNYEEVAGEMLFRR